MERPSATRPPFQPGKSGNPRGRPKGSGKRQVQEELLRTVVAAAKQGDARAAQFLLEIGFLDKSNG